MIVGPKQASEHIVRCIKAGLVAMLSGNPGSGKSAIVQDIAKTYNLQLVDVRLSQCDPVDLSGFPMIVDGIAKYVPMNLFPIESTPIPKGKSGFLIFLDELNSSSLAVQAASYRLLLDREIGQHKLHPKAAIVAAGNLATDGAIVNRIGTAMQSRLIHLELGIDVEEWVSWASSNGIDHRIIAYIHGRPENLHKFNPKHHDKTFASPRTWHFASKILKNHTGDLKELTALLAGTISEAVAREFIIYSSIYTELPSMDDIVKRPLKTPVSTEPSMLYALAHMIAAYANKLTLPAIMQYTDRMPLEFETITLQSTLKRDKALINEPVLRAWVDRHTDLFL